MAVGLNPLPELHPVPGVRLGTARAGLRSRGGKDDLLLVELVAESRAAAVFTRNAFCAAPVSVARDHLQATAPRWLLVNAGNANAGTGRQGIDDAEACCRAVAAEDDGATVLPFSTGVIGEPLPVDKLVAALPAARQALVEDGWATAASAIMTTDTLPKGASRRIEIDGRAVTVTGIAKGAGMIRPDMATMLAFVATDALLPTALLKGLLDEAVDASFNRISVDGDTSTNDACVLLATGSSGVALETPDAAGLRPLAEAVTAVCIDLAQAIVRDGEGATKFITVQVEGGRDTAECRRVAETVAHSPLVKTAFYASDPNWGRILAAVGRAGLDELDLERVAIDLDEVRIVAGGGRASGYAEPDGQRVMDRPEITIRIDLGRGAARDWLWTCDFSHDYVTINAEYRT